MQAAGTRYIYYPSRSDTFRIWAVADIHLGSSACHKRLFERHLREIADDPFALWVGLGDYCDHIGYRDRRFDPRCVDADILPTPLLGDADRVLIRHMADYFKPIAHKCLGLAYGNHERAAMTMREQQGLHAWLCSEIAVPDLGYSFLMDVAFTRKPDCKKLAGRVHYGRPDDLPANAIASTMSMRVFGHHGAGGATTSGGKHNRLRKFMDGFDADVYLIAHVHDQQVTKRPSVGADRTCTQLRERLRIGSITGGYLRSYPQGTAASYTEAAGYDAVPLGAAIIEVVPDKRELSLTLTAEMTHL